MAFRQILTTVLIIIDLVYGQENGRITSDRYLEQSESGLLGVGNDGNEPTERRQLKVIAQQSGQSPVTIPTRIYSDNLKIYLKSGLAVRYTTRRPAAVILTSSADEASEFLLVPCLALTKVDPSLRRQCFSLMAAKRLDWYVRQHNLSLFLESSANPRSPETFDLDSSFVIYEDQFYQNFFAFDSVRNPGMFITSADNLRLKITEQRDAREYFASASFALSGPANYGWVFLPSLGKYYRVIFQMTDWKRADERCRELGVKSHLVVVNDKSENEAIKHFLRSLDNRLKRMCIGPAAVARIPWIGGYWTSGRRSSISCGSTPWIWNPYPGVAYPITFTDWNPGQPDCATIGLATGEHFIHLESSSFYLRWNDFNGDMPLCALCELD